MAPSQILHYRIERKIGQGGMGEVYLATDTRLNRQVALKFIPESLSADPEARERLLREAQAASKLNHPNIVTVHSIERDGDRDFIVMEYVSGKMLGEYFSDKQHSLDQILDIALQLTEALQKAHAAGVIHRDLKPGNVLVDADGRPRILDFGLAKIEGAAKLTQTGSTMGTMAYISPEQAQGREVDQRSDLFSFGVLLYEMIAGRVPFSGDHEAALIYAIVNEQPEPLARFKKNVPESLERIVAKCLAKDPGERYQSTSDLLADLKRERRLSQATGPAAPVAAKPKPSRFGIAATVVGAVVLVVAIAYVAAPVWFGRGASGDAVIKTPRLAVLPFENIGAAEDEYFADGMTEEIIARLASVSGVEVIARTSIMQYKGTNKSVSDIGQELDVDYILEGTIRWQKSPDGPGRVRITPQLVKTSDGAHVWANIYENELTRVFDVQSDVSQKVVSALNVTLLEPERRQISSKQTEDIEAYNYYLKGNEYWRQIAAGTDESNLRLAVHLYSQSVGADSQYADAWARLGRSYVELFWHHERNSRDLERARVYIDRALTLDPQSPEVRIAQGSYHYHAWDYDLALQEFGEARKLQPNNADLVMEIGYVLRRQGRPEAMAEMQRALELDPLASNYFQQAAVTAFVFGRHDDVIALCDRAIALTPDAAESYGTKAMFLLARDGDTAAAQAVLDKAQTYIQPTGSGYWTRGYLHMLCGRYQEAITNMELGWDYAFPMSQHYYRGFLHELLGQKDRAHAIYDSALVLIDLEMKKNDELSSPYSTYGMVLAALGRGEEALVAGKKGVELNKNAQTLQFAQLSLARIYTCLGDADAAVRVLELALKAPGTISAHNLRLDPNYAPLRDHPRFKALVSPVS